MAAAKKAKQRGENVKLPTNTEPEYLVPFLSYASNNLNEYLTKMQ
jgi:hypothetical protein